MKYHTQSSGFGPVTPDIMPTGEVNRPFSESFFDAFSLESTLGSLINYDVSAGRYDPEHDPLNMINETNEEYALDLIKTNNAEHFRQKEAQIQKEQAARERLERDGGWGIAAYLSAGLLDPINLIPVGGAAIKAAKGGSILKGLTTGAYVGTASTAAQEVILQGTQSSRSGSETAINLAAGTLFGGIIGGAAGSLKYITDANQARFVDDIIEGVDRDMQVTPPGGSLSAASAEDMIPDELAVKVADEIDAQIAAGKIAPEARDEAVFKLLDEEVKNLTGMKQNIPVAALLKVARPLRVQTPTMRNALTESSEARKAGSKLMETSLIRNEDQYLQGAKEVPVERLIELWQGNVYNALRNMDDSYYQYLTGRRDRKFGAINMQAIKRVITGSDKMSPTDFRRRVGQAMRNGDVDEQGDQFVEQAAKNWRKEVYDPLKERAIKEGILPEDVQVETAVSYLNRVWKTDEIIQRRPQFIENTVKWFQSQQGEAQKRLTTFEDEMVGMRQGLAADQAQIEDIKTAIQQGAEKTIIKQTQKAVDEAVIPMDTPYTPPTAGEIADKAAKTASAAGRKAEVEELTDILREEVTGAIDEVYEETVANAIARAADGDVDAVTALKEELALPLPERGGAAADAALDDASRAAARDAGAIRAQESFDRSVAAQTRRIEEIMSSPAAKSEAGRRQALEEVRKEIRKNARAEVRDLIKKETKELSEIVNKRMKEIVKRKRLNTRDQIEATLDDEALRDIAGEIADRITGTGGVRLTYDMNIADVMNSASRKAGLSSPFKQRSFLIPDNLMKDFLEDDIETLGRRLVDQMAPDIEIVAKFGDLEMESTIKGIRDDWNKIMVREGIADPAKVLDAEGNFIGGVKVSKKLKEWARKRDQSISDLLAVRDRLRGVYKMPEDPTAWRYRAGLALRQLNYIRMLGGMTVSAIPDMARPIMIHGFGVFSDGFSPMLRDFKSFSKVTQELRDMGLVTDMLMNSRAQRWAGLSEPMGTGTIGERALGAMADTFGTVSLMSPWNAMMKQFSGAMSHASMIRYMRKMVDGKATKKQIEYLKQNYIDLHHAQKIIAQIDEFGETSPDGFVFSNVANWSDLDAVQRFRAAIGRDINRTIIEPGQDIPLWASGPIGKMLFQFKSFGVAATERMLIAGLQQNDIKVYMGMLSAVFLGMVSGAIKNNINGNKQPDDIKTWIAEGVDRSGVTGWFFEANNIIEKLTQGNISLKPSNTELSRFAQRNWAGSVFGPSFGTASSVVSALGDITGAPKDGYGTEEWARAAKLLPYSNLFYLRKGADLLVGD